MARRGSAQPLHGAAAKGTTEGAKGAGRQEEARLQAEFAEQKLKKQSELSEPRAASTKPRGSDAAMSAMVQGAAMGAGQARAVGEVTGGAEHDGAVPER